MDKVRYWGPMTPRLRRRNRRISAGKAFRQMRGMGCARALDLVQRNVFIRVSPRHEFPLCRRTGGTLAIVAGYCLHQLLDMPPQRGWQVSFAGGVPLQLGLPAGSGLRFRLFAWSASIA